MPPQSNMQIEIAGLSAVDRGAALARQAYGRSVAHPSGNVHFNRLRPENLSGAAARWARLVSLYAGAVTRWAGFSRLQLQGATSAAMRFFQRQFQLCFDILSPVTARSGSACATEQVSKVKAPGAAKTAKIEITEVEACRRRATTCSLSPFPSG